MKTIILIVALFATSIIPKELVSETKKKQVSEFKVSGVCKMCKKRIETATLTKGVRFAEWNAQTQILKVIFQPKVISELEIKKNIAQAGHDTEEVKASDSSYQKLPACCAYRDGVEVH